MSQKTFSWSDDRNRIVVHPFLTLGNQPSATGLLMFSPDGTILASCAWKTRFWYEDAQANWTFHHTSPAMLLKIKANRTLEMLFFQDGRFDRIELQESEGTCLQTRSCRHIPQKYCLRYSPDEAWLLTWDGDGWLYFWDAETLRFETRQPLLPADMRLFPLGPFRFTSDGKYLFFRNGGSLCRCQFSGHPPKLLPEGFLFEYPRHRFSAEDFALSPQGGIVAVANTDSVYASRGIDLYEERSLHRVAHFPVGDPFVLDFSPDGKYLACVDVESNVSIWNVSAGRLEQTFVSHPGPVMEQTSAVASIAWSPRGDIIAIEGELEEIHDYSVKLWKVEYVQGK